MGFCAYLATVRLQVSGVEISPRLLFCSRSLSMKNVLNQKWQSLCFGNIFLTQSSILISPRKAMGCSNAMVNRAEKKTQKYELFGIFNFLNICNVKVIYLQLHSFSNQFHHKNMLHLLRPFESHRQKLY